MKSVKEIIHKDNISSKSPNVWDSKCPLHITIHKIKMSFTQNRVKLRVGVKVFPELVGVTLKRRNRNPGRGLMKCGDTWMTQPLMPLKGCLVGRDDKYGQSKGY